MFCEFVKSSFRTKRRFKVMAMNDNKKVMRVLVSEDKSFKVSAKSKRHSIVGNRCVNGLHVATSLSQKKKRKKKEGLIIHDSMRKPNSLIVSLFIFWRLGLSLCDFDTYEMNSLTACLNSFLFLKWSFFGSLSLPSTVRTPAKKVHKKLHIFTSKLRDIQRTSLRPDWRVITTFHFIL